MVNTSIARDGWNVGTKGIGGEVDGAPNEDEVHGPFTQHTPQ